MFNRNELVLVLSKALSGAQTLSSRMIHSASICQASHWAKCHDKHQEQDDE